MCLLVYALVLASAVYIYWARDRWDSPIDYHIVQVHRYLYPRPSQHLPYSINIEVKEGGEKGSEDRDKDGEGEKETEE